MKKKVIVSMLATMLMAGTMSVTAYADTNEKQTNNTVEERGTVNESTEADAPKDSTVGEDVTNPSTGSATITGNDASLETTGDDDAHVDGEKDINGADINVWGKVEENTSHIYKVDIGWGAMKFEFNRSGVEWNVDTHQYEETDGVTAKWTPEYIDGTNNKITVTNHSNDGVKAKFTYDMPQENLFNADSTTVNAVKGNFYTTNAEALNGALTLTATTNIKGTLSEDTLALPTAAMIAGAGEEGADLEAGARSAEAFFAFCGTPDVDTEGKLSDFKKVGVINVQITPDNAELAGNE